MFWLYANNDKSVSTVTSNKQWQTAVRYALDYKSILSVAGPGADQTPGLIPSMFARRAAAKEAVKQNVAKAKAALAASGAGEPAGHARVPERPDDQRRAVRDARRRRCRRTCRPIGINVTLSGSPTGNVADELPQRQDGLRPVAVGA